MSFNENNMFDYYKKEYERFIEKQPLGYNWNEYVNECDEKKYKAVDCLINGITLEKLKEILEKELCPVDTQETQELCEVEKICNKCVSTNKLHAKYCCECGTKFTGYMKSI